MAKLLKLPTAKSGGYRIVARGNSSAEIYLYGTIGGDWFGDGVTAKQFADDLKAVGDVSTIDLRINSDGGDVFAGKTMYTLLTQHKARIITHIDGLAASAASFIAMAGDEIEIAEGAFMMIHNAWSYVVGNAADMRRTADLLDAIDSSMVDTYVARTKNSAADVKQWMAAETWWSGKECVEHGFADRVVENLKAAAKVDHPERFKKLPAALRPQRAAALAAISRIKAASAAK